MEPPSKSGEYSGDASGSAPTTENVVESLPLPFPPRFPDFPHLSPHVDRFAGTNDEVFMMNNGGSSSATSGDAKSCFFVSAVFSLFAMAMVFGLYGSETLRLGPNTSILIKPNNLFVDSIKVVELDAANGSTLYGFYKTPPLDVLITWSETHKITLPASTHKEWIYSLNEGSHINISYSVNSLSSSSIVLVIVKGIEGLAKWLGDPLYPDTTLLWNIIHGNGSMQKDVSESSTYYIAVGNLNTEVVEVHLNTRIKAFVYNTTEPCYKCTPAKGQCTFPLSFLGENAAVLTSPGQIPGMINGDFYVKLSYGPRLLTYLVGAGGMTSFLLLVNYFLNHYQHTLQDTIRDQLGDTGSERNPLLPHRDDNISSKDSSNASIPEDGYLEEAQTGAGQGRKPVEDEEYRRHLCAICFDAQKDCFFFPCGHSVACFECATRIVETSGTCPICRRSTKKVSKIYTV